MALILALLLGPSVIGIPLAARDYPWRSPRLLPYAWFVIALAAPLLAILALQAGFTLPPGTCSDSEIKYLPVLIALAGVVMAAGLLARCRGYRRFIAGVAVAVCPPTLLWSLVASMSLAGCWI